jgi:plastocyanin
VNFTIGDAAAGRMVGIVRNRSILQAALATLVGGILGGLTVPACGSSPTGPSAAATFTLTASGVSPKEVRIRAFNFVTFVNNDTRAHTMVSDPVDLHDQCPALNRIGVIQPGETRDSSTLSLARTCGFHDHSNPSDTTLLGRIIVE